MADLVTLDEARAELKKSSDVDDEKLQGVIDAATEVVENIVGPVVARSVSELFPQQSGSRSLWLSRFPILSVDSVTVQQWGVTTLTYQTSQLLVDLTRGTIRLLRYPIAVPFTGDVTVVYTVGRTHVPATIREGALQLVRHMWETQRGQSTGRPSYDTNPVDVPTGDYMGLTPPRVRELLAPYAQAARLG